MKNDDGYVLAMMGLLLIPLCIMTAFAVDLGAWYAQGAKLQRIADAAALAGVVHLPNQGNAEAAAQQVLSANGYSGPVEYGYPNSNQMQVKLRRAGSQFFSQIVFNGQTLRRDATAEFNKPVPLGSPADLMGNSPAGNPLSCTAPGATCSGVWAAINGPYTAHEQGDPYTTKCLANLGSNLSQRGPNVCDVLSNSNGAQNPDYKPNGYTFAIDIPSSLVGQTVTVELFDAIADGGSPNFTGDSIQAMQSGVPNIFSTQFELFRSDGSDVTVSTAPALSMSGNCSTGPGRLLTQSGTAVGTYKNQWTILCRFIPVEPGIHPLVVKSSNISGVVDSGAGTNQFSIRATTTVSAKPTVYAIQDMSLYTPTANSPGNISKFYLANIGPEHKGKTLLIDLFDPGDGNSGTYTMQFRAPPGGAPAPVPGDSATSIGCNYNSTGSDTIGPPTDTFSNNCTITTRSSSADPPNKYNNKWLRVRIVIPTTYNCTDCWWTIRYNYGTGGDSTDRTVWTVNVVGDPVHLVD